MTLKEKMIQFMLANPGIGLDRLTLNFGYVPPYDWHVQLTEESKQVIAELTESGELIIDPQFRVHLHLRRELVKRVMDE